MVRVSRKVLSFLGPRQRELIRKIADSNKRVREGVSRRGLRCFTLGRETLETVRVLALIEKGVLIETRPRVWELDDSRLADYEIDSELT